jgi:hypothetical protein
VICFGKESEKNQIGDFWRNQSLSDVQCANPECRVLNRVSSYSVNQVPRCPKCGWVLPETHFTTLLRAAYKAHPSLWIATGTAVIVIGFSFLDRYAPASGLAWNIINGTIKGLAYRYVFTVGVLLVLFGGWLWARK